MVEAWKDWLHSEAGKKCADPHTLPKTGMYLENRLQSAFYAGIKAEESQRAAIEQAGK